MLYLVLELSILILSTGGVFQQLPDGSQTATVAGTPEQPRWRCRTSPAGRGGWRLWWWPGWLPGATAQYGGRLPTGLPQAVLLP